MNRDDFRKSGGTVFRRISDIELEVYSVFAQTIDGDIVRIVETPEEVSAIRYATDDENRITEMEFGYDVAKVSRLFGRKVKGAGKKAAKMTMDEFLALFREEQPLHPLTENPGHGSRLRMKMIDILELDERTFPKGAEDMFVAEARKKFDALTPMLCRCSLQRAKDKIRSDLAAIIRSRNEMKAQIEIEQHGVDKYEAIIQELGVGKVVKFFADPGESVAFLEDMKKLEKADVEVRNSIRLIKKNR
ncbi:uncharacterized protein LOC129752436 [Uranotaenia lowii]|uniref:uncharacterized protein LOC129752436 n=1 Tax=Uranotaenia lowii TaxID=190385 RepID=UPI002478CB8E|nr:uncharacterized protein LOC129752436 [Uranotaenia lowii]